jgi:uncharacterized repeat protein (TIGR03806 family)
MAPEFAGRTAVLFGVLTFLSACGGGGGDGGGGSTPAPTNTPPVATFTASAVSGIAPLSVQFDASASTDPGGSIVTYAWQFGDGSATATGITASHVYQSVGTYAATLTVTDNLGATGSTTRQIAVANPSGASGLDLRPSNVACLAPARSTGSSTISTPRAYTNLMFLEPVALLQAPGDGSRWYVVEQNGVIRVFDNTPVVAVSQVFLDIRDAVWTLNESEAGLLGLAFHPNFAMNGRAYVNYTALVGDSLRSITSEFTSPDRGATLDPNSERVLLSVTKRQDNHNGGHLAFGSDGFLYIGLGDGGGRGDPEGNAQNPRRLLGKMLRIDVDTRPGGQPYGIPGGTSGNPYAGNSLCNADGTGVQPCPEIYALGFRNPWRWSFDRQTGQLWVGDVGQSDYEEIDVVERGGNYGWNIREGAHCFLAPDCQPVGLIDPVAEYDRRVGISITGGFVYRGSQATPLRGQYLFGDFGTGMIATLAQGGDGRFTVQPLIQPGTTPPGADGQLQISAFGEGNDGELYLLDYFRGYIRRLVFVSGSGTDNVPQQLSATGCINMAAPGAPPLLSLIPYAPNAPFWSDNATKERWIGLPNGQNVTVSTSGAWEFPNGSVLVKHFRLGGRLIETRLFMRHPDGVWAGYTYEWNQAQTDATRVSGGRTVPVGGQNWIIPSEAQCMQCHTQAAGFVLGLETAQLNGAYQYAQTGRTANQITTLNAINVLSPPAGANPPDYADPADVSRSLNARARSYLHTNCANCHRPQGPTPVALDLRHDTALSQTGACDVVPAAGDLGIANARIIAAGDASRSVLLGRMARRDANAMPPLASNVRDTEGEALIGSWIDSLTSASCQ